MDDGSGRRSVQGLLQASRRAGDMGTRDGGGKGNIVGDPVVHFEIGGKNAERTRAFYSELFGWDIGTDEAGYRLVDTRSDIGIRGGMMLTPPEVPPYLTVYVAVDDLAKYLKRAEELGGSTVLGPMPVRGIGAFAMLGDPDGNIVGLFREAA
jgi:predicted enzyme related to lactoylglutathione lyase